MLRILVVDDEFTSRTQLKALLSIHGDCDIAPNSEIALLMISDALAHKMPYALITMDVEMPQMNGVETVAAIRKLEQYKGVPTENKVKIVMITIKDKLKDVALAYKQDCSDYLVKPVTQDALRDALQKLKLIDVTDR